MATPKKGLQAAYDSLSKSITDEEQKLLDLEFAKQTRKNLSPATLRFFATNLDKKKIKCKPGRAARSLEKMDNQHPIQDYDSKIKACKTRIEELKKQRMSLLKQELKSGIELSSAAASAPVATTSLQLWTPATTPGQSRTPSNNTSEVNSEVSSAVITPRQSLDSDQAVKACLQSLYLTYDI